jgi:lysophospholipid acyltransferase (LPLAT)-like uncharacterized protein
MKLKESNRNILRKVGNILLPFIVDLLLLTVKVKLNKSKDELKGKNFIAAFWHGKMLIGWHLFRKNNPAAIVSTSKDGELLTRVLKHWDYDLVRGSSSKGGKEALQILIEKALEGKAIVVTPDGPLGPAKKFKAGAVIVAQRTLKPLLLTGIGYEKSVKLKSWDEFEIPYPFSRVYVEFSEPVLIEQNLSYDETSEAIKKMEDKLNELTNKAENIARHN